MATGATFATLIEEVQYEIGHVVSPAAGQNYREHIKSRIKREYRRLYHDHNWRHLREREDVVINAGQRYYDYPDGAELETIIEMYVRHGASWIPITDDFDDTDYNGMDSDEDVRSDPVQKWRPYGVDQFEIWPMPASATTIRVIRKKPFEALTDEDDRCLLDTDVVVLHAAAELLRKQDDKEAALVLGRASQHYDTLKMRARASRRTVNMTGQGVSPRDPRNKVFVGVSSD